MSQVASFYDEHAQLEWERLERHRMELAVTMRAFADHLPSPPATVLDVGGGPGRYSIALAQRGYIVILADISAAELELARGNASEAGVEVQDFVQVSGTDLVPFPDSSFDVVLLMGPLYHLLELEDREQMVREALRVARPGALICATFITRYAFIRDVVKHKPEAILSQRAIYGDVLGTGKLTGPGLVGTFTDAHFALPGEVQPLMEGVGLETLALIGVEGVTSLLDEAVNKLEGGPWESWVEINYQIGKDPSTHGAADHLLYVGRKRATQP